jgi:DNA (cytosine-5)-methyltransferase 1
MTKKSFKIIDIFSGCGGLSLGFEATKRFETCLAIDIWDKALQTLKFNKPTTDILVKDLSILDEDEIKKIKTKYNDIKVVVGGPPCQGFSQAGQRNNNDPRNQLYKSYIKFIKIINPEWFVFENVAGLMSMKTKEGDLFIDKILSDFKKLGYNTTLNLITAKDFGVPQDRKRVIIIGNNLGINIPKLIKTTPKPKTVREAISDLEQLESGQKSKKDKYHFALNHAARHIKWLKNVPEGKSAHEYKEVNGMTAKGYNTTYKRIWWDKPSPAITTCFSSISSQNNVHPTSTRALTIREAMRIQTFPDHFEFVGSSRDIRTQIGNAVPPKLAEEIAKQLLNYFI